MAIFPRKYENMKLDKSYDLSIRQHKVNNFKTKKTIIVLYKENSEKWGLHGKNVN